MTEEFTEKLKKCLVDAKIVSEQVKKEKAEKSRIDEEKARKKAEEDKIKMTLTIIGNITDKIDDAANNGLNWFDIKLPEKDFYNYKAIKHSGTQYAYDYLKTISGLTVEIKSKQEECSGSYGEREVWTTYYMRILF